MKKVLAMAAAMAVILMFATFASAQTQITTGTIEGTISDPTGAVIPGAKVEIRNLETNLTRTITTDNNGRFVALLLPPGSYQVNVSKEGFAPVLQENVELTVGRTITLPIGLGVAGTEERIVVTSTPTVETVSTQSSSTLNETTVQTTPVLGRKFEDLLTLTPGVGIVQGPDGDEITFNGQRGIFNNISLDGGDYQNGFFGEQVGGQRAAIDIGLDAVQEFQVIAAGGSAEYGRAAGGIVNVITKSGTNDFHGSIFHFQRLEALTSDTADGKPLTDFHREQSGFTFGGPIARNKSFFFINAEHIGENLQRANLSEQAGDTPCPVSAPAIQTDEALIDSNVDCQRVALLDFLRTSVGQEDGLPVRRPGQNWAFLGKWDWNPNADHRISLSFNHDRSLKINETFDVPTYGNSANGIEGTPSVINTLNANVVSTFSPTILNEAHFTYSRENRPRLTVSSNVPADTAMGFVNTFRFGSPFFLQPNVDELFWRTQVRDAVSIVKGEHSIKFGGDWMHSLNDQVFRGFFTGRYIFDSVTGFLRYASPDAVGGFGPDAGRCADGSWTDIGGAPCGDASAPATPLLLYLQGAALDGPATDATGASNITNEDFALFIQDRWQIRSNLTLNYGLRWEAQTFPDPVVPPAQTAYGALIGDPSFPSDGTIPDQWKQFQPRVGLAWDVANDGKSVLRASFGIYNARQNMLTQVGAITTNGVQQQTIAGGLFANPAVLPTWPGLAPVTPVPAGQFPPFSGVRVFDREYHNPRVYQTNFAFERELASQWSAYADFTWAKAVYLTVPLDYNHASRGAPFSADCFTAPDAVCLGETMVTTSSGNSLYRGLTFGMRKHFSQGIQMDWNYTYSQDWDNDSNERDPFVDRSVLLMPGISVSDLRLLYSPSDRDIRHRFNFVIFAELPFAFEVNSRIQARSAQPITPAVGAARNSVRKENEYFSWDWRIQRPIRFGERYAIIPILEMFNTFNNDNFVYSQILGPPNVLDSSPGLFNFDGFLRQGPGDPRQVQFAVKFTF